MAESMGYTRVAAPDMTRERQHGLLSVAQPPVVMPLDELLNGIRYAADCGTTTQIVYDPCGDLTPEDPVDVQQWFLRDPAVITAEDQCWYGTSEGAREARARSKLARLEGRDFAAVLAGGAISQNFAGQPDVEVLAPAPVSLDCALGLADTWAIVNGLAAVAYAPSETSGAWRASQLTDQAGRLTTLGGTRVALVPYVGTTAPLGSTIEADYWLWLTGPLRIFWAEPVITLLEQPRDNQYVTRASRTAVLDWVCRIAAIPLIFDCEGTA